MNLETKLESQKSMEQLDLYEACPGCTSYWKHVLAAICITVSFVLFVISVSTNYWVVTSSAHVGLFEICNKGDTCRWIDSNCHYSTPLTSNFVILHGSCDMLNVSRAFTTIACVCAGIAFLCTLVFHSVNWYAGAVKTKLSKWGAILYGFAAGITGLIGMALYARYIVLNDDVTGFGKSAEVGYSFGLSILAWVTALVSAVFDVLALQFLYWEKEQKQETVLVIIKPSINHNDYEANEVVKTLQKNGFHIEHRRRRFLDGAQAAAFCSHLADKSQKPSSFVGEIVAVIVHREHASKTIGPIVQELRKRFNEPDGLYHSRSWREAVTDIQLLYDDHDVAVVGPLAHSHAPAAGPRPSLMVNNSSKQTSMGQPLGSSSSLNSVV